MLSTPLRLVAALALLCAAVTTTSAEPIGSNPYTRTDGTVVLNPSAEDRANEDDGIYTILSGNGPMAGRGPSHGARRHFRN